MRNIYESPRMEIIGFSLSEQIAEGTDINISANQTVPKP